MYWQGKYNSQELGVEEPALIMEEGSVNIIGSKEKRGGPLTRGLFFLFLLGANVVVMLSVYDFCVAKKGTPFLTTLKSNYMYKLCTSRYFARKNYGKVSMIIRDDTERMAMINDMKVKTGYCFNDVKVVRIGENKVDFKKGSQVWTQKVGDDPSPAWH
jgi:hypothetical protein